MSQIKITVIYDNRIDDQRLKEGWGFSCLVEWENQKILFDTGGDQEAFFANAEKLNIRFNEITHLLFSHKHWDHITGFDAVMKKLSEKTVIYLPKSFPRSLSKKMPAHLQIHQVNSFVEIGRNAYSLVQRGGLTFHEQALILNTPKGLVIITGCAHAGIVSIVKTAQKKLTGPIHFVMGGFHLFRASKQKSADIVQKFLDLQVEKIAPCHCSGDQTIQQFEKAYTSRFFTIGTGTTLTI